MPLIVPNTAVNVRHRLELTFEDLHKTVIKVEQKPGDAVFFVALRCAATWRIFSISRSNWKASPTRQLVLEYINVDIIKASAVSS